MKAKLTSFGEIEVKGKHYTHDVVIKAGKVSKRKKKPSKPFRDRYGHTPLSINEEIPWGGDRLIIGTGMYGNLPVMPELQQEAERRHIELVVVPTTEACRLLEEIKRKDSYAILHCTC